MAQDSRKKRHARRVKIQARIAAQTNRQQLRDVSVRHINAQFTLLAVLRQYGGSVTVAADIATALLPDFQYLNWQTERLEDGTMKVSVLDKRPAEADIVEVPEPPTASETNIPLVPREPVQ